MNFNDWRTWLKISIVLFCLILISLGFLSGYIYNNYTNKVCREQPFSYAINTINDIDNDNFMCSCTSFSNGLKSFNFNESGFIKNPPLTDIPFIP